VPPRGDDPPGPPRSVPPRGDDIPGPARSVPPRGDDPLGPPRSVPASADQAPPRPSVRLTENGLPQRVRQASLAPQLRGATRTRPPASPAASPRSPETARSVMAAYWQGWQRGLSDDDVVPGGRRAPQERESR
jgi:hypothetical protein